MKQLIDIVGDAAIAWLFFEAASYVRLIGKLEAEREGRRQMRFTRRLLEGPLKNVLDNSTPDAPAMLTFALAMLA